MRGTAVPITTLLVISAIACLLPSAAGDVPSGQDLKQADADALMGDLQMYMADPSTPAPVGIAAFGLYNATGKVVPYEVSTDKIVATATIKSLRAGVVPPAPNSTEYDSYQSMSPLSQCRADSVYVPSRNDVENGANLQFNVMMDVKTKTGQQTIWLQDTARFNTASMTVNAPHDIVANLTSPESGNLAYGNGIPADRRGGPSYYEYEGSCFAYALPLKIVYQISVQKSSDGLVQVQFRDGNTTFDTVYLPIPNVESAHLLVAPVPTPAGIPYDAELVWTGYCCGLDSNYTGMDSTLSMLYEGQDGTMHDFPSHFTFGVATAENATILRVRGEMQGGHVMVGQNRNSFLQYGLASRTGPSGQSPEVPAWIKEDALLWSQGQTSESEFARGIQYMIHNGMLSLPPDGLQAKAVRQMPSWLRNDAGWWAYGQISDSDYIKSLQWLAGNGYLSR